MEQNALTLVAGVVFSVFGVGAVLALLCIATDALAPKRSLIFHRAASRHIPRFSTISR